ncbi:SIP domain-containing protein [Donghicola sp. B5-SW-15]|uniref:SIP domain-containing protein n=2 Tax=Donghicola mangrovi TaxID=2729614 RepID=A0A850QEX4_9RHOB|nr:SIP domain-containing protein [Donghicola mangrovi]
MIAAAPRHGYEIMTEIETRTAGAYRPSPGVIYPVLSKLEDEGLISCEAADGKRKLCQITDAGAAYAVANHKRVRSALPHRGGRHNVPFPVRDAMDALKAALRGRMGTADTTTIAAMAEAIHAAAETINGLTDQASEPDMNQIITRHRHEIRRRTLTVTNTQRLTPHMIRVELESPELEGFTSLGFDDHIKLFFDTGTDKPAMRDYTPRGFDAAANRLTLDFAVHDAGPATDWALNAGVGTQLQIGGPRGSAVIAPVFDWYLLVGDETALPAMGRRVEELPAGVQVITVGAVIDGAEEQTWTSDADLTAHWVHRPASAATNPAPVLDALRDLPLPEGRGFIWIAAEASVARAAKEYMLTERTHPREWLKASGYWVQGEADAKAKLDD